MTTKKDLNTSENIDHTRMAQEDWKSHHELTDRYPGEAKDMGETEVKNAHAAGDGAMGPNETPLPDVDMDKNKGQDQNENPPY